MEGSEAMPASSNLIFNAKSSSKRYFLLPLIAACAAVPVRADIDTWIDGSSNWSIGSNWSSGNPPAPGDSVFLTQSDSINRNVTLDVLATLAALTIDSTGPGVMQLIQPVDSVVAGNGPDTLVAGTETIGLVGTGVFNQISGTNVVIGDLDLGVSIGASGKYLQQHGTSSVGNIYIGGRAAASGGTGLLNITGGDFTTPGILKIWNSASPGVSFSAGTLTVASLDSSVTASNFKWTGGTLSITGNGALTISASSPFTQLPNSEILRVADTIIVPAGGSVTAVGSTVTAATVVSDGTIVVSPSFDNRSSSFMVSANEYIGSSGQSTLTVTGGVNQVGTLYLGYATGSQGILNVSTGNTLFGSSSGTATADTIYAGYFGTGTISNSAFISTKNMFLGYGAGSTGTYSAGGGLSATGNVYVGYAGAGSFNVSQGTQQISGDLNLGVQPGSTGNLKVDGGNVIAANIRLGQSGGTASVNILSGSLTATGTLELDSTSSSLVLDTNPGLGLGTLRVGNLDVSLNPSAFQWIAGNVSITGPAGLTLAATNLGTALALPNTKTLFVANTLTLPSGTGLTLGGGGLSAGTLDTTGNPSGVSWTAGTLAITGPGGFTPSSTNIGANYSVSSGKTLLVSNTLRLPAGANLALAGGTIQTGAIDTTGNPSGFFWSTGTLAVTGGAGLVLSPNTLGSAVAISNGQTLSVNNTLSLTSSSKLTVAGGTVSAGFLDFSANRTGFSWTAGTVAITGANGLTLSASGPFGPNLVVPSTNALIVSSALTIPAGTSVALDGGTLAAGSINATGNPIGFSWNSGTLALIGQVPTPSLTVPIENVLGTQVELPAGKTLSFNGNLTFPAGASLTIDGGALLTSSANVLTGALVIDRAALNITGGVINLRAEETTIANNASGSTTTINQSGGQQTLSSLIIGNGSAAAGTFNLFGGSLTSVTEAISGAGAGIFNQFGGINSIVSSGSSTTGLSVGNTSPNGPQGIYNLFGDATLIATNESIGGGSSILTTGTLNQSGGSNTLSGDLTVGSVGGSNGTYNLVAGTLGVAKSEFIGSAGAGTLNQSGGANSAAAIVIGVNAAGTYNLTGGTVSASVVTIGSLAAGTLNITGATLVDTGAFTLADSHANVTFNRGLLSVGSFSINDVLGTFNWTAGTLAITGPSGLIISGHTIAGKTLKPAMTLNVTNTLYVPPDFSLNISGGALTAGFFQLNGTFAQTGGSATVGFILGGTAGAISLSGPLSLLPSGATSSLQTLTITSTGLLDFTSNSLLITYTGTSPVVSIRQYLTSAYANGTWSGPTGITSSVAANDPKHSHGIGYIDTPSAHTLLLKYTLYGDSSLDGKVDLAHDFNLFLQGFAAMDASSWALGDYNYDGVVNNADFDLFIDGYKSQGSSLGQLDGVIESSPLLTTAQKAQLLAAVPEPAVPLSAMGLLALSRLRRRRNSRC
jgi:fibronectin-binding autotransporter adhesin